MGILSSELPDFSHLVDEKYFITYKKYNDNYYYYLTNVDDSLDGIVNSENYSVSTYYGNNWVLIDSSWKNTSLKDYTHYYNKTASDIVYTSYDMHLDDGKPYYYKSSDDVLDTIGVIGNTVTSSSIMSTLNDNILPTLSILVIAIIAIIAFRKCWGFIYNTLKRGA